MADDRLELIASVKNLTSGPLKDIQRSMRALAADTKLGHQQGITFAKGHTEQLYKLRREIGDVAERVKTGLSPALGVLGLGSLSAAAGVAALTKSLTDFASNARHLEFMSKQTQLTVNQLRAWEQEASRLGTTTESLTSGFTEFNASMEKMARMGRTFGKEFGIRTEMQELQATLKLLRPSEISGLVRSLQGLSREAQIEKVLKFADKIPDIAKRMELLKAFHLDPALANKQSGEILKDLDEIGKRLGTLTEKQLKAGTDFQESIEGIKDSLVGLRDAVGAGLAEDIKGVAEAISDWAKIHHEDIVAGIHDFVKGVGLIKEAIESLRKGEPVDLTKLIDFAGFDKTAEVFLATWKARFAEFKSSVGLGDKGEAADLETERLRLLKQDFPDKFEAEERERQQKKTKAEDYWSEIHRRLIQPERIMPPPGTGPGGKPTEPLWRRLFRMGDNETPGGAIPASWTGALATPGGSGDPRAAEGVIERGVLSALRDFAAETKGAEGGGGGGGAGAGLGAIRAAYSPGGSAGGTGEPSADGGAGTGGGAANAPMGRLPGLGGLPEGIESLKRSFHPPSIPAGMGGTIADRLKSAGVNLPPHLDAKIRKGGQVTEGDLKSLPPATLEKINKHITGLGQPPLYTDAKPQHFSLGDIRKSVQGGGDMPTGPGTTGVFDRSRFSQEIKNNPALLNRWIGVGANEDYPSTPAGRTAFQAVLESAANRASLRGTSLAKESRWTSEGGYYEGHPHFQILRDAKNYAAAKDIANQVLAGSNVSHGATDNSSQGLAEREAASGKFKRVFKAHGESFFTPGWAEKNWERKYPGWLQGELQRGEMMRSANAAKSAMPNIGAAIGGTATQEETNWQRMHDSLTQGAEKYKETHKNMASGVFGNAEGAAPRGGKGASPYGPFGGSKFHYLKDQENIMERGVVPSREQLEPRREQHADLLGHARQAGLVGAPLNHKVTGNASVDINLAGFPRGTTTKTAADGMFKTVRLNRGRAMGPASQEG